MKFKIQGPDATFTVHGVYHNRQFSSISNDLHHEITGPYHNSATALTSDHEIHCIAHTVSRPLLIML